MNNFNLATRFRLIRRGAKMTQQNLADLSSVSRNTISLIENGRDKNVRIHTLIALSPWLDVPAHTWLLSNTEWLDWFYKWSKGEIVDGVDSLVQPKM